MRLSPKPISNHRLARLIVCARAMIVWAAAVFFEGLFANRRRIRQRYGALCIGKLTRLVRNLLLIHAAQFVNRSVQQNTWRNYAPAGFTRRRRPRSLLRSIAGGRLRRYLCAGSLPARFARLIHVISNLDACARKFLLRRAERGLHRFIAMLLVRPPHEAPRTLALAEVPCADTS
jgi:hypothetical protein